MGVAREESRRGGGGGGGGEEAEAEGGRGGQGAAHLGVPAPPVVLPLVGCSAASIRGKERGYTDIGAQDFSDCSVDRTGSGSRFTIFHWRLHEHE